MLNRSPNCGEMCSLNKRFWTDPKRDEGSELLEPGDEGKSEKEHSLCFYHSFSEGVLNFVVFRTQY